MLNLDKYATAAIVERRDISPDLWAIRIVPDVTIPFHPGQYVTIGLECDGRMIERPYSIASSPEEQAIELFIERVPEGEFTGPLYELGVGDTVAVRKRAKGLFLKGAPFDGQGHFCVATVTGVAPFVSLVRQLIVQKARGEWTPMHQVTILQGASRVHELGYDDELHQLAAKHDWFSYIPTVSQSWHDEHWAGEKGRVDDVLRKHVDLAHPRAGDVAIFLCGHPGMIGNARTIMRRAGVDNENIHEEQYWPE